MRTCKFIGTFRSDSGHEYQLSTTAFSFLQAFFKLTAKAIDNGSHYQLKEIVNSDKNSVCKVGDIMKCSELLDVQEGIVVKV